MEGVKLKGGSGTKGREAEIEERSAVYRGRVES